MSIDILGNEWLITCLRWFLPTTPTPYEVNILHYFEYTLELYILGAMSQAHSPQRTLSPEASLAGKGDGEASACDAAAGDVATDAGKKKHRALRRDKKNSDGNTKVIVAIGESADMHATVDQRLVHLEKLVELQGKQLQVERDQHVVLQERVGHFEKLLGDSRKKEELHVEQAR